MPPAFRISNHIFILFLKYLTCKGNVWLKSLHVWHLRSANVAPVWTSIKCKSLRLGTVEVERAWKGSSLPSHGPNATGTSRMEKNSDLSLISPRNTRKRGFSRLCEKLEQQFLKDAIFILFLEPWIHFSSRHTGRSRWVWAVRRTKMTLPLSKPGVPWSPEGPASSSRGGEGPAAFDATFFACKDPFWNSSLDLV